MDIHKIVPDVLDRIPCNILHVKFEKVSADLGNILTPTEVKDEPSISWDSVNVKKFYTLCCTDPDAPSRQDPKFKEWQHWLVVNIPGGNIENGEVLTEFVPSAPGKDSGLHRYTYLIYEQPGKLECDEPRITNRSVEHRRLFSIRKFAEKYNLGRPEAGNFYLAEWDEHVPTVRKQLGLQ